MKLAIINERSTGDKNKDIVDALDGLGHEVYNLGVRKNSGDNNDLTYIDTGFMTALLLNTKRIDFVIGGCGTGQGWAIAANKFPGVFCGHILNSLDAWLFPQINNGNCISLALNQGYGWAGEINLKFVFERLLSVEKGSGYPKDRKDAQQFLAKKLENISNNLCSFAELLEKMDKDVVKKVLTWPGVWELLDVNRLEEKNIKEILIRRWNE